MRLDLPWRRPRASEPDPAFEGLSAMHAEVMRDNALLRTTVTQWQEQAGKLYAETDQLRRESEHWRNMYEMAMDGVRAEREKLVAHIVELKREGFGLGTLAAMQAPAPEPFPPEIDRAIDMRGFDPTVTRANREYALEQLRLRPDKASEIAREILAGEQFDVYAGTEDSPL